MISVVVPVKGQWPLTARLLHCLKDEPCRVLVIDNGSEDDTLWHVRQLQRHRPWKGRLHWTKMPGYTIYQMWNEGFAWASKHGAWHVLITNNDIVLPRGALEALQRPLSTLDAAWISYPDYDAAWRNHGLHAGLSWRETSGVYGEGGMFGACFMVAGHKVPWRPLVTDLTYEWWYGDNHLAQEVEEHGGKQVRVVGLPVEHVHEGTARFEPPDQLWRKKYADRQRWLNRYTREA